MTREEWLAAIADSDPYQWLFGDGNGSHGKPLASRSPLTLLPELYSFAPHTLEFLDTLVGLLDDALTPSLDTNGFVGANGIHTSFGRGRTVAGYGANPLSFVSVDNHDFASELGLPDSYRSPRHEAIFKEMWRLVFSSWTPRGLKTPKASTAGFPTFSYDAIWKRTAGLELFSDIEDVLKTFAKGDLHALARQYGIVFAYNLGKRSQVDSVGRERIVFDYDYAVSGGKSGSSFAADKKVVINGVAYDQFSATRERVVQGAPYLTNLPLQAMATGHLYALFDNFPQTFHHTDIDALARSIKDTHSLVASDITEYDRSMQSFLIDTMLEVGRDFWDGRLINWVDQLIFGPYYARPLSLDGKRGTFVGNPYIMGRQVQAGNRSGHAWTSLIAKAMKVGDTLCVIDDLLGDVLENIPSYLRGERALRIWNNGDDEVIVGPKHLIEKFRQYRFGDKQVGYFVAKPEEGQVFSGEMFQPQPNGGFRAIPRLHTTLEKLYVPERSIGGIFRPRWTIGVLQRFEQSRNPSHHIFIECHMKAWRDILAPKLGDFSTLIAREHEKLDFAVDGLTLIDKEVLEDPDKIHYKYDEKDLSSSIVLDAITGSKIMPEEYSDFMVYYGGSIV